MAGISSEMLKNMLRSNLNSLKSFAELLNAELTEDVREEKSRESHKTNVSQILQKFGEAEAYFEKGVKCLQKVDTEVKGQLSIEEGEHVDENQLLDEIKTIIHLVEGKERIMDAAENANFEQNDENRIGQQLHGIEDILNEVHPLRLENEDDGDYDSEEENRVVHQLEEMQKRAMIQSMDRVTNDEEVEGNENFDDSDEEEVVIAADSFERVTDSQHRGGHIETSKLDQMWNNYKKDLIQGSFIDAKQVFDNKISSEADVNFETLPLFSKYNENILELFSKEAIVVLGEKQNYMDPISKTAIQNPVRNKLCQHIYERDTIYSMLRKKKTMACPCLGCSCRSFGVNDLEEDEETMMKITQSLARARASEAIADEEAETDREDLSTDDEAHPEDDTQSQEIL